MTSAYPPKIAPKTALLWTNYGAYHYARASALAAVCQLLPLQLASFQRKYGWTAESEHPVKVKTIFEGHWEDRSVWRVCLNLLKALQTENPDVLMVPGYSSIPSVVGALWGRFRGKRTILMFDTTEQDHPRTGFKEAFKGLLVRVLFDRASVAGTRSRSYLQKLGFAASSIDHFGGYYDVVNNEFYTAGTRSIRLTSTRQEHSLPANYILYVGRLSAEKNLPRLLEAYGLYLQRGGRRDLVLVGTGAQREMLAQHETVLRNPDRVHFAGFKNGSELLPYYAFADCFVLPSLSEPWGLVVNEAMASGLPVIVSRVCGCADDLVEEGVNGFLIDPASVDDIAAGFTKLDSLSPQTLADMGACSLAKIADYSPGNWAKEIVRLISN